MPDKLILLIHCPDREGLVASVTEVIRRSGGNIVDLDQHVDTERGVFFMRVAWTPPAADPDGERRFQAAFVGEVATPFAMTWRLERAASRTPASTSSCWPATCRSSPPASSRRSAAR
jgi:formyltetrahydrofolate deformylase